MESFGTVARVFDEDGYTGFLFQGVFEDCQIIDPTHNGYIN
ncbi:hypothetical protein ACPOL_4414 [Acidisarcina polymorpha]|uniref:Uncharacterized protein n=1 Tax=Acidisarcina polymorpha TaxID=2211140 RepID=A0A2Z5G4M2_9BACT|nr:hypothetical protein ACPOL_4414 [Acidisarcina polymorpha]